METQKGPLTYEAQRLNRKYSFFTTCLAYTKTVFATGYYSLQFGVGESGVLLGASVSLIAMIFLTYQMRRLTVIANEQESNSLLQAKIDHENDPLVEELDQSQMMENTMIKSLEGIKDIYFLTYLELTGKIGAGNGFYLVTSGATIIMSFLSALGVYTLTIQFIEDTYPVP